MSAVRCPLTLENFHIFYREQCENTFIKYVRFGLAPSATTKLEIFHIPNNTCMEYRVKWLIYEIRLYKQKKSR